MDEVLLDRLLVRAGAGDHAAFEAVVERTLPVVRGFVAVRAARVEMVDDVVQATYLAVYQQSGSYQARGTPVAWLCGIARNQLHREWRRVQRLRHASLDALDTYLQERLATDADEPAWPATATTHDLERCLQQLTPRARTLVLRHHAEGVPLKRLAQQFRKPANTLAQTLHRVRVRLRTCLESRPC